MERCWEELYRAGKALAEEPESRRAIVDAVARDFELPASDQERAVLAFLDGVSAAFDHEARRALFSHLLEEKEDEP